MNEPGFAPWDPMNPTGGVDPAAAAAWQERERRQRTIRLLMMFLLMLLLMDSEEQAGRKRLERGANRRGHRHSHLTPQVFGARLKQENRLNELTVQHPKYAALIEKNKGKDISHEVRNWAEQQAEIVKDEFVVVNVPKSEPKVEETDPEENIKVFHYPWNATGFYRGEWTREKNKDDTAGEGEDDEDGDRTSSTATERKTSEVDGDTDEEANAGDQEIPVQYIDAHSLELEFHQQDKLGVILLPPGKEVILPYDHSNFTAYDWSKYESTPPPHGADRYFMRTTATATTNSRSSTSGKTIDGSYASLSNRDVSDYSESSQALSGAAPTMINPSLATAKVTLTKPSGRAAFQLFSRSVPAMQEVSLVDGFLKLYDSNMPGYSTHKDILLRVRGVLIHGIGRLSLIANAGAGRSVFFLGEENTDVESNGEEDSEDGEEEEEAQLEHRRRRLEQALSNLSATQEHDERNIQQIRDDAIALYGKDTTSKQRGNGKTQLFKLESLPVEMPLTKESEVEEEEEQEEGEKVVRRIKVSTARRTKVVAETFQRQSNQALPISSDAGKQRMVNSASKKTDATATADKYEWSDVVIPYPFVLDDEEESIRKTKTPAARKMPPREQLLERNAGICEFEVTMDAKEVEWTLGEWRKMVGRRVKETMDLNPANHPLSAENEDAVEEETRAASKRHRMYGSTARSTKSSREQHNRKPLQDQALVMTMIGSINSPNCDFSASLNVTALRTDWEHTTGKAINYSFYMMLTCLTQIMVLLRQLLHTQAQSAATRVSLLCIGWQTVLDALLCLGHIYLSLAMQPLFTAFASVAFFKLLIFCVIEMKYMALIIQARNSSNGGNTTELLRRQVAMLHLRFYVALFGAFLAFFYAGDKYRIPYNILLYSFWVPQIVQNVITEAKRPMHNYYIYGMSLTRLVAPLYIFAVPNNFLKEVYPESPTDLHLCELLVLWVGLQTAVLIAQGKYGARFMIPARFLPPKFDYNRPIPQSLLPPGTTQDLSSPPDLPLRPRSSDTSTSIQESQSLLPSEPVVRDRHTTGVTRNRIKGSRLNRPESTMTAETVTNDTTANSSDHTLDCVICYNAIDVHNRRGYMLAPCDHIFHKDCLVQWMDVKMECPICRTELPSL